MPKLRTKKTGSSSSSSDVLIGLSECYNFLTNNQYSDKTIGLPAFILRKSVGDINFSHIINEVEKRNQQWQAEDFVALLEDMRKKLQEIEASIEKCLMINRSIKYIADDPTNFQSIISSIQEDMRAQMTDDQMYPTINYPEDFRQREKDFHKRKDTQNLRRLFYLSPTEAKASSLFDLQNRTTSHLTYIIDHKMRHDISFRETGFEEIKNIFGTSFMILVQPKYGVNPVLIHDRKGPGKHAAKVSVIIISLLHDFIQTHPNMIKLDDIEPSLWPSSPHYKLAESHSISWKTVQLQLSPEEKSRTIQYAELSEITIKKSSSKNTSACLGEVLHTFNFPISLRLNLTQPKISKTYHISIQSLPFAISAHTSQISHYLTRVLIDDIRRFSQLPSIDVNIMLNFLSRYFIHRTGVEPKQTLRIYLEEELKKAKDARNNCQTLEDIFMDFLVPFVHQVEFMGKHPVLAMFYADGLFLGSCNSEHAVKAIIQPSDANLPILALRFNSNRIDLNALTKSKKEDQCSVRVVIYNTIKHNIINCTFDTSILLQDLFKFVSSANNEMASSVRILSGFDNQTKIKTFNCYKNFDKYYDGRLQQIAKSDPNYKHITDLFHDMKDDNGSHVLEIRNRNSSETNSPLIIPTCPAIIDHESDDSSYMPVSYTGTGTNQTILQDECCCPSNQELLKRINDDEMIRHILSRPELLRKLLSNLTILPATVPIQQQLPYSTQLPMYYPNQQIPFPYQQQSSPAPFQIHSQQLSSSISLHQMTNGNVCQQWPVGFNDVTQTSQMSGNDSTQSNSSSNDIDSIAENWMEIYNGNNQEPFNKADYFADIQ